MRLIKKHAPKGWQPYDGYLFCDYCQRKIRFSEARTTWDNFRVCEEDYDVKHPALYPLPTYPEEGKPFDGARHPAPDQYKESL